MRAFSQAWPDAEFVQEVLAQLPWYHQLALLDKLPSPETRRGYVSQTIEHTWSRNTLVMHIENRLLERSGKAENWQNNGESLLLRAGLSYGFAYVLLMSRQRRIPIHQVPIVRNPLRQQIPQPFNIVAPVAMQLTRHRESVHQLRTRLRHPAPRRLLHRGIERARRIGHHKHIKPLRQC